MAAILKTENISYSYYGRIPALVDINIAIGEGEKFAIIGSNGSGKSTLLQALNGLIHPSRGTLYFRDEEVSEKSLSQKNFLRHFRERVGFVFQDSDVQLFSPTVLDEMLFGPIQLGIGEEEAMDRSFEIMAMLGIENLKDRPSYMLSGGEKKRVAIGSVLTMNPEVLLLDEPANGLDPKSQVFLIELIFQLHEAGKTIIMSTHDLSLVSELDLNVAVLSEEHRVERVGMAEEVLKDQDLLLKVNLIHGHLHAHGETIHRHPHSHYLFHKH
jgi:cobalt/nickel transport system ATP-binding protein